MKRVDRPLGLVAFASEAVVQRHHADHCSCASRSLRLTRTCTLAYTSMIRTVLIRVPDAIALKTMRCSRRLIDRKEGPRFDRPHAMDFQS